MAARFDQVSQADRRAPIASSSRADRDADVIVIGAGNAALAAAAAAFESGARVLILEKAPRDERGGNSRFSGALFRFAYDNAGDILPLFPDLDTATVDVGSYPPDAYYEDLMRTSGGKADRQLAKVLVEHSYSTVQWLTELGVTWALRASPWVKHKGGVRITPGAVLNVEGKGVGLMSYLFAAVEERGIPITYETQVVGLHAPGDDMLVEVTARRGGVEKIFRAAAVVLAAGGFEADESMRATHLGPDWRLARVRGTRFNTGETLQAALRAGAVWIGETAGCHATPIDATSPEHGDLRITDETNRLSYPYGVMVNRHARRFIDEGEDLAVYTYAKTGDAVLKQPEGFAYQIFDQQSVHLLEPRYQSAVPVTGMSLEGLAQKLELPTSAFVATITEFNRATNTEVPFDPSTPDGRGTIDLEPPKSNWAVALERPPFLAFPVTCGITFTYGGIKINADAQVITVEDHSLPGMYATGEITGGLFVGNYAAGAGLMFGAVFGRIAGRNAARMALAGRPPSTPDG